MKEKDANNAARLALVKAFPSGKIYKHNDMRTKGIADTTFTMNGPTSWLEFKMLEGDENIHSGAGKRFRLQLIELYRLERATNGKHSWVIAYRKATSTSPTKLTIYKPSALLNLAQPIARENSSHQNVLRDLQTFGVAQFPGFDHAAVVELIRQTHETY